MPEMPGIMTSDKIRSGEFNCAILNASSPFLASKISKIGSNISISSFRNSSSSSTISKVDEWSKSFFCCAMKSSRFSFSLSMLIALLIISLFPSSSIIVTFLSSLKCSLPTGSSTMNELPLCSSLSTVICP